MTKTPVPVSTEIADNTRTKILSEAIRVLGHRGETHGSFRRNLAHTAALWTAYLGGVPIMAADVAIMMTLVKASRVKCGDQGAEDHYIDMAGYAAIAAELNIDEE